jgi:hypothetical protein
MAKVSEEEFIRLFKELGSPVRVAEAIGANVRNIYQRRRRLEAKSGDIPTWNPGNPSAGVERYRKAYPKRLKIDIPDGYILVGSDAHIWPGYHSTALKGLVWFCKHLKPKGVVLNGDIFDFARIGWSTQPTPMEELTAALEYIKEIEEAAPGAEFIRTPGNHCLRLEGWISNRVPELEGIPGTRLGYYMPRWKAAWAVHINNQMYITHRLRSGVHAGYNNARALAQTTVTGHLHCQDVRAIETLNGRIYGVDTGSLAETDIGSDWPQFEYTEGSLPDWRAGFGVFQFKDGKLLPPELATVTRPGHIYFRGVESAV